MSEVRGPLSAIVLPLVETADQHSRLPPQGKILAHAGGATELLAWCAYVAPLFEHQTGTPFNVWAGVTGFSALWLLTAWWASRRYSRDFGIGFWALSFGAGSGALLWWQVYPADWGPVAAYLLRGFYWSLLAVSVVRLLIATKPFAGGGNALRIIKKHIKRRNAPLRAARSRSY